MTAGQAGTLLVSVVFTTFPGERNPSQDDRAGQGSPREPGQALLPGIQELSE